MNLPVRRSEDVAHTSIGGLSVLSWFAINKTNSILLPSIGQHLVGILTGRGLADALLDQGEWRHWSLLQRSAPRCLGRIGLHRVEPGQRLQIVYRRETVRIDTGLSESFLRSG